MPQLSNNDHQFRSNTTLSIREFMAEKVALSIHFFNQLKAWFAEQSPIKKVLVMLGCIILSILGFLFLIFHSYLINQLINLSDKWHDLKYGSVIIFALVFTVSFPPLIGFTALSLLTGMVYGFPQGWPLLAFASVSGCTASFLVFRYLLQNQATKLVQYNEKFRAFAEVLHDDSSLLLLCLIRLCPLPYSLSNGALAAVPELPLLTYFLATLITSPKLFIHLFVGSKLKDLGSDKSSGMSKVVDVISIVITGGAASLATYLIYVKMQQKLASFHQRGIIHDDVLVFGNFADELEMGSHNEIELNSTDFDTDNFLIDDDEEDETLVQDSDVHSQNSHKSQKSQKSQITHKSATDGDQDRKNLHRD